MDVFDIDELVPKSSPVASGNSPHQAGPSSGRRPKASADDCLRVLNDTFGYDTFRGQQQTICETALTGQDILVIAPTGMGKSLCFQVPAIAENTGVTLVVSPLLALMKNQVAGLRKRGVHATAFTSETTAAEKSNILAELVSGRPRYRLLYITPEKLNTVEFIRLMDQLYVNGNLNRFTVDEAHCISEWGHDFRDSYRKLGYFRERYPDVPIMALTASATATVQDDVVRSLRMSDQMFRVVHPFNRGNLFYEVQYRSGMGTNDRYMDVHAYIDNLHRRRGKPSSGIVYCRTRATCNELSDFLRRKGINAKPYHKGVGAKALDATLNAWEQGGSGEMGGHVVDVVCATIAFGMGIDKGDVRYIIHYDLPKSFEGYYQETGRAGRDGVPSKCVLFYSREDAVTVRRWVGSSHTKRVTATDPDGPQPSQRSNKSLGQLLKFAENVDVCRHVLVCRYFGEVVDERDDTAVKQLCNKMCDVCKMPEKVKQRKAELSTQEFACSQAPAPDGSDDEEAAPPPGRAHEPVQQTGSFNAWTSVPKPVRGTMNKKRGPLTAWFERDEAGEKKSGGQAAAKKTKLATSTFNLTSSRSLSKAMKKPFRTPFMVSASKIQDENDSANPAKFTSTDSYQAERRDRIARGWSAPEVVDLTGDDLEEEQPITSMDPPDIRPEEMFLDMEFSEKVALDTRKETFRVLFHTLWIELIGKGGCEPLWTLIRSPLVSSEKRDRLLLDFARHMEWQMHSWSKSDAGYAHRVSDTLDTIRLLSRHETWADDCPSELVDAHELSSDFREFAQLWKER